MLTIKQKLIEEINKAVPDFDFAADLITDPPRVELGEFALPCFVLAKEMKKNPNEAAKELAQTLMENENDMWDKVAAEGPYVNFHLKKDFWIKAVLLDKDKIEIEKKKIMIEFSQPNTHKQFHVGHLRNVSLGASLVNINKYLGQKVIAANYIGDIGTHVAKCLWNFQKNHLSDELPVNKGKYLGELYVDAVNQIDDNEELKQEVSQVLQDLESRQKEITKLWKETKDWSLDQFKQIYEELNVDFDVWFFESEEEKAADKLIKKLSADNKITYIKESEGAIIADLQKDDLGVLVLIKSDGTKSYGAKDLPLTKKKFDQYKIDESVWVVDKRQELYMKQIFRLMDVMGYDQKKTHVAYDFVTTPAGPMSSRKGNVIAYEDFRSSMLELLVEQTRQRHPDWDQEKIEKTSFVIAMAAVKFAMLKYENKSLVVFDMDSALSFEGATGPYLLYTLARMHSILKKAKQKIKVDEIDFNLLKENEEMELIKHLSGFEQTVALCAREYQPSYLCTYLIELAQKFNTFYHKYSVLKSAPDILKIRLLLVKKVIETMTQGLELLNIEGLDEM